jgi:hypothetical protein
MEAEERERIAKWLAKDPESAGPWDGLGPRCTPEEVFPWLASAPIEPVLDKSWQEWRATRKRVDPDSCRHEIGRGEHWRLKRRDQTGLVVQRDVTCRICGKVLKDAAELDNGFISPKGYIGPQIRVDDNGEEYERCLYPIRFDASSDSRTVKVFGHLWGETAKLAYQKLLAKMPATVPTFNLFYPDDPHKLRERRPEKPADDRRWKRLRPHTLSNVPECQDESFLHNVRSLFKLRVALHLWHIEPNPLDDPHATYRDITPPAKRHPAGLAWVEIHCPRHHDGDGWGAKVTNDKLRTRFTYCKKRASCPGFIVRVDDTDIQIRQHMSAGDIVRALRIAGHTVREISEITGIPVRTVERRLEGLILGERVCDTSDTVLG